METHEAQLPFSAFVMDLALGEDAVTLALVADPLHRRHNLHTETNASTECLVVVL